MNILLVKQVDLSSEGVFIPNKEQQKHIYEVLRLEDKDIVKVGVINGQIGLGQLRILKDVNIKAALIYEIQLLPLYFRNARNIWDFITQKSAEVEFKRSIMSEKPALTANNSMLKFPALSERELNHWLSNPYEKLEITADLDNVFCSDDSVLIKKLCKTMPSCYSAEPAKVTPAKLILAIPRPNVFVRMVKTLGTLDVSDVLFYISIKSEIDYLKSSKLAPEALEKYLFEAMQQACRTYTPTISLFSSLDELIKTVSFNGLLVVAHPYSLDDLEPLGIVQLQSKHKFCGKNVFLAFGPEAGFTNHEIEKLRSVHKPEHGFELLSMGHIIYTCEVAVLMLTSQFLVLYMLHRASEVFKPDNCVATP